MPARIARPLIEGLRNEVVVRDPGPAAVFGIVPLSYVEALGRAIDRTDPHGVESTWFDALAASDRASLSSVTSREGMIVERRELVVAAPPERISPRRSASAATGAGRTRTCSGGSGD